MMLFSSSSNKKKEGLAMSSSSDNSTSTSTSGGGVGNNSNNYLKKIESELTKLDDKLAITTNLSNYNSIVSNYSMLLTYKMLDTILTTDIQNMQNSLEQLQLLNNANNSVRVVSSVLQTVNS